MFINGHSFELTTHSNNKIISLLLYTSWKVSDNGGIGSPTLPSIRLQVRRMAALTVGCNFLMRYIYIPSEHNPADAPSRGVMRRVRLQPGSFLKRRRRHRRRDAPGYTYPTAAEIDARFFHNYGKSIDDVLLSEYGF